MQLKVTFQLIFFSISKDSDTTGTWYSMSFSRIIRGNAAVSDKSTLLGEVGIPVPVFPLLDPFTMLQREYRFVHGGKC